LIQWQYFPKSDAAPDHLLTIVEAFQRHEFEIASSSFDLTSNEVLRVVREDLCSYGFRVESSRRAEDGIKVPVLFGKNGSLEQFFRADGFHPEHGTVLEVEAGRAVVNYQFLKDLFEACMMHDVNYLAIAVRSMYKGGRDFEKVTRFFETLYASRRLNLPLHGILIIGY
jgi:hypothetical protein